MKLVITDTPAQAKRLSDALGDGWRVEPCAGLVRDLPTDKLGIEVENDFQPVFAIVAGQGNRVRRLMKSIRESSGVYVATPPNRAGEAMAWHVLALSPDAKDKPIYRVILRALAPDPIHAAFAAPRPLDMDQIEAEVTRSVMHRLIGWSVSAAVRKANGLKTALTYDEMIVLRLLQTRAAQMVAHTPETRWQAAVTFERDGTLFTAQVMNSKGAALRLRTEQHVAQLESLLKHSVFWVDSTSQAIRAYPAPKPFTLTSLIDMAERELALSPARVMTLLETLYDAGWINHPDTAPLAEAVEAARAYVRAEFGTADSDPEGMVDPGIAPVPVNRLPDALPGDGASLYALIWKRFIAAHLPAAQERRTRTRILVGSADGNAYPLELHATAKLQSAEGWRRVLASADKGEILPYLRQGDELLSIQIAVDAVTREAPVGYTAASLIQELTQFGTDERAATRALDTLYAAEVVVTAGDKLSLTESGLALAAWLTSSFDALTSPTCAAELHGEIDRVASGERARLDVLRAFWSRFGAALRLTSMSSSRSVGHPKPIVLHPIEEV